MSAEPAAYPKLLKIYQELNRQNGILFDAERECNELELERDSLKGFAKLTKKGELQSKIDRKNGEIELLKVGLSGIVKRYGFQTVHDFYKAFATAKKAYADYRDKADKYFLEDDIMKKKFLERGFVYELILGIGSLFFIKMCKVVIWYSSMLF